MRRYDRFDRPFLTLIVVAAWLLLGLQVEITTRDVMGAGGSFASGLVEVFSYFTELTSLIVAVVATVRLWRREEAVLGRPGAMAAATVYVCMVGVIYAVLLRNSWAPTGWQLVADVGQHYVMPVLFLLYWLIFVRKGTLRWRQPVVWLIYLLAYVAYGLTYGRVTGRYFYYFADASALGYPRALTHIAMVVVAFLVAGLIAVGVDREMGRRVSVLD
jgi:hypothetical protein